MPYLIRWNFQTVDDSITSKSPREFLIDPKNKDGKDGNKDNKDKKNGYPEITILSKRPMSPEELKNLISLQVIDRDTGNSLLVNGKSILVPTLQRKKTDGGDGEKELVPSVDNGKKGSVFEPISVVVSPSKSKFCPCL